MFFGKDGVDVGYVFVNGGKCVVVEGNIYWVVVNVVEL